MHRIILLSNDVERNPGPSLNTFNVCKIQMNRKKYFFATICRSPSQNTIGLRDFMENFELMLSKMASENPYCVIITGDFNVLSPQWWEK